uniref:Family with sequence similarity 234 member B n=1 Tax=Latimeria chalumnae TaxID=7897 RepID=H3A6L7_LATCH
VLEVYDVNEDHFPDVLLSFPSHTDRGFNSLGLSQTSVSLTALSGANGTVLWSRTIVEEARSIECGLGGLSSGEKPVCILTGTGTFLATFNASTGDFLWEMSPGRLLGGTLAAPAVFLPDLDRDGVVDLLLMTLGYSQPEVSFLLVSGRSGSPIGGAVKHNITGEGKLIGPQAHITSRGAVYILFGFGNIRAVALRDIFAQANNRDTYPPALQIKDPKWEQKRPINLSELLDIYSRGVEYLRSLHIPGRNCSDLLIATRTGLTLLGGGDLESRWQINLQDILSAPEPGFFNSDGVLDFLLQVKSGQNMKMVMVVDGRTGQSLWSFKFQCHMPGSDAASLWTSDGKSAFLFWAENPKLGINNSISSAASAAGAHHRLYLLHPAYPTILLELANSTAAVMSSAVGIKEPEKEAFYITMATSPAMEVPKNHPGPLIVSKLDIRWAVEHSTAVQLGQAGGGSPSEARRILSKMQFRRLPQKKV